MLNIMTYTEGTLNQKTYNNSERVCTYVPQPT